MIRICPERDAQCPNGMACAEPCAGSSPKSLTPREKVARQAAEAFHNGYQTYDQCDETMRLRFDWIADAILTALASGSGDHAELARLAEAATQGPWFETEGHPSGRTYGIHSEAGPVVVFRGIAKPHGQGEHNAAFIAAANPATVLSLIAEIAALRGSCDNANDHWKKTQAAWSEVLVTTGCKDGGELVDLATRATEAERKLADERLNYEGALSDIDSLLTVLIRRINGEKDLASAAEWVRLNYPLAAEKIISKEAERGCS